MPIKKGSSKKPQSSTDAPDDQSLDPKPSFIDDASPSTSPLDPTSAAWRNKQRKAISQLSETQARLIWEDEGASRHLNFRSLDSSKRFDNIEEILKVYASIPFPGGKVSLCALLALAINDYTCYKGIPGRMRHSWGINIKGVTINEVYFAAEGWSQLHQQAWRSDSPLTRLDLSTVPLGWHWKSPETRVIPIRILELMKEEQSIFEPRFDSSESKFRETDYKGVVLIFKEGQIRFSSMVDFVATKGLHISNRPSQTEFRMMPSERWSEIGKPIKWDTFCSNLIDMILDEKDVITTVWGKEYDRVLPKG